MLIHFCQCACAKEMIYLRGNGKYVEALIYCEVLLLQNITDVLIFPFSTGLNLIMVILGGKY